MTKKGKKQEKQEMVEIHKSFEEFVKDRADKSGRTVAEEAKDLVDNGWGLIEFDEAQGKASLVIYGEPTKGKAEVPKNVEKLMALYKDLRENFAPVSAGLEYHKTFLCGGGFIVITDDPRDKHKKEMKKEAIKWNRDVSMDYYNMGLDRLLYIMADDVLTYGVGAAEIVYENGNAFSFEDFAEKKTTIVKGKPVDIWTTRLPTSAEWKKLGGISRIKILNNAKRRLKPYRNPKSFEVMYWTLDESSQKGLKGAMRGRKGIGTDKMFHPWQILLFSWNTRGTELLGHSIIKPIITIAKMVREIHKTIGIGLKKWADKKYFFVCTPAGTLVWTPEGYKPIEEIKVGDLVWSEHSTAEVLQTFKRPYKGDLITIKPTMLEAIQFTPNHPIKIAKKRHLKKKIENFEKKKDIIWSVIEQYGNKYINGCRFDILEDYKRADELTTDDYVIVPKIKGEKDIWIDFPNIERDKLPSRYLSEDLAKLFGWYLAEGCIGFYKHKNKKSPENIIFSLGHDETHYANEIIDLGWNELGIKGTIYQKPTGIQVYLHSKSLAQFIFDWFGHGANDKHLPETFLYWKPEILTAMISRILMGDGHLGKDDWWSLKLNSKILIKQLQLALLKLGHRASFASRPRPKIGYICERKANFHDAWILRWNENNRVVEQDNENYYFRIKEINRESFEGYVYNFHASSNEMLLPFRSKQCGTERRPWSKAHIQDFMKMLELMVKRNWTGIPVPMGFDVKDIGGELFQGRDILDHLINMICLTPDTLVITNPSIKQIKDIKVGDMVLAEDGVFRPVEKLYKRKYDGYLIIIQPHYGLPIKITPNHKVYVWRDEKEQQIPAGEILKSDLLTYSIPKFNQIPPNKSEAFMKFLGYYISDGHTHNKHPYKNVREWIYITLNIDEKDKVKELVNLACQLYDKPRISIRSRKGQNVIIFGLKDPNLAKWLDENCGHGAVNKHIPEDFMGMTKEQFKSLFDGLMAGDGYIRHGKVKEYATSSRQLMGQLYLLLMKYGYTPAIDRIPPTETRWSLAKGGKKVWSREAWKIRLCKTKMKTANNKILIPIHKISTEEYHGYVHNIQVNTNHSYSSINFQCRNCAGMNYPREFLEQGRVRAGDKAWLAWQVKYGANQRQLRRAIEHQLWRVHLWCKFGQTYKVPKQGVKPKDRETRDIYIPKLEWRAEGRWQRKEEIETLQGWLNVANPVGPEFKLAIEKRGAEVMGFGEIEFPSFEELRRQLRAVEKQIREAGMKPKVKRPKPKAGARLIKGEKPEELAGVSTEVHATKVATKKGKAKSLGGTRIPAERKGKKKPSQ